jgi:hypothetical protein
MASNNFDNKLYIICGSKGRGKTTMCTKVLTNSINKGLRPIIYDVRRDYLKQYNKPFLPKKEFMEKEILPAKKSVILLEESTIFFPNTSKDSVLYDKIIAMRYDENDIILVYHSLRSIPSYILEQGDFLILFKTSDNYAYINSKFRGNDDVLECFESVQEKAGDNTDKKGDKINDFNYKEIISLL